MNTHELWQAVLGELELTLSRANFTTWFRQTGIIGFKDSVIVIGVPSNFTKTWLEKKYHKEILHSLQRLTGNKVKNVTYCFEPKGVQSSSLSLFENTIPEKKSEQLTQTKEEEKPPTSYPQPEESPNNTHNTYSSETIVVTPAPASQQTHYGEFTLNTKYTFSNFVVGKQNELAHAAAQAVASQPSSVYSPLFIYGGVGLGKTHLLQAIGNEIIRKNPETKVLYVTCERFTNDFIQAVRNGKAKEFKDMYRTVDLFLIDDIQFITGKEGTQEEFFHTFNQLHHDEKKIIISSDRPPKAIAGLEERLSSRFEWGMMTDIGNPDFETRVAILELKCRERSFPLQTTLLHLIANTVHHNVRELEGALNKIIAHHQFRNIPASRETIQPILDSLQLTDIKRNVTPRQLIQAVATYFELQVEDLVGKSREKRFAFPRQIIMYLLREEMKASYPTIGAELGGRDHTTAMHAYDKISQCLTDNAQLQHDIEHIKQKMYTA